MVRNSLAGALALLLAVVCTSAPTEAGAQIQDKPPTPAPTNPDTVARAALDALRRALAEALQGLPQYSAPEFTERGDIIIRRVPATPPVPPLRPRSAPRFEEADT